jgi:hypothetical protein
VVRALHTQVFLPFGVGEGRGFPPSSFSLDRCKQGLIGLIRRCSKETAAEPLHYRRAAPELCPNSVGLRFQRSRAFQAICRTFQRHLQRFAPTPASIGIPISGRNPQRPYGLTQPHYILLEPRHLCRPIGVRHIAVPAFRSFELSGAPGVTSGLEDIFFLDSGVSRP